MSPDERHRKDGTPIPPEPDGIDVWFTSIIASKTSRGMVDIHVGPTQIQVEPTKARELGLWLLEVAEAAEYDEGFYHFATTELRVEPIGALNIIAGLRSFRKQRAIREQISDTSTAGPRPSAPTESPPETPPV